MKRLFVLGFSLLIFEASAFSQIGNGLGTGNFGTFNTYSGSVSEDGSLKAYNGGRIFTTIGKSGTGAVKNINLWTASNNMTFGYGFLGNFDALVSVITYQDLNVRAVNNKLGKLSQTPSDLFFTLRNGSHGILDDQMELGGALTFRLPLGDVSNVPFEVYRSSRAEFGLLGSATFYGNPYYKDQSFFVNANLGFWSHNDNGQYVNSIDPGKHGFTKAESQVNSLHMQYGLGVALPVQKVQFILDLYGISYLTQPDAAVFSRESFMYVTPGLRYNLRNWMSIGTYVDVLLTGKKDQTKYSNATGTTPVGGAGGDTKLSGGVPNYSTWRFGLTLSFNILPLTVSGAQTENRRKRLLDRLQDEDRAAQRAAAQLDKLRDIRMNSEKELEDIKLELESGGN